MLAPSGYRQDYLIDPVVQSTTRPAGTLLRSSPGYDTIRVGKNKFQGKGPTGGFREQEFGEDVGGSGAALSIVPGDTSQIASSEWLPESPEQIEPASFIIADRNTQLGGIALTKHEAERVITDLGDRSPGRPLSMAFFKNPVKMLKQDYAENPVVSVIVGAALVVGAFMIGNDLERQYKSRRGGGIASDVTAVPASGAVVAGDTTATAADDIGNAADKAIKRIEDTGDKIVKSIEGAAPKE